MIIRSYSFRASEALALTAALKRTNHKLGWGGCGANGSKLDNNDLFKWSLKFYHSSAVVKKIYEVKL